jgi:hypothetical protein
MQYLEDTTTICKFHLHQLSYFFGANTEFDVTWLQIYVGHASTFYFMAAFPLAYFGGRLRPVLDFTLA